MPEKRFGDPMQGERKDFCPLVPTRDYVIARKVSVDRIGSIHVPDSPGAEVRLEVIATGPDVEHLQVGDCVIPNPQYTGKVSVGAKEYIVCQEEDVPALFAVSRDLEVLPESNIETPGQGDFRV